MKIVLVDNYDSFIYNLKYELELTGNEVTVCRNDVDYKKLISLCKSSDAVVISPGPGAPNTAGHCLKLVKELAGVKPILGVCLGHQVIVQAFGGEIGAAKSIVHGKTSRLTLNNSGLLATMGKSITVARYHSLAATRLPGELQIDAVTVDGEVMAVSHLEHPIFGLQFHPESIMSKDGTKILQTFVACVESKSAKSKNAGTDKEGVYHAEFA